MPSAFFLVDGRGRGGAAARWVASGTSARSSKQHGDQLRSCRSGDHARLQEAASQQQKRTHSCGRRITGRAAAFAAAWPTTTTVLL